MYLSNCFPPESILRDGAFSALCLSDSRPGAAAFSFLEDPRYAEELNANPKIACVICTPESVSALAGHIQGGVLSEAPGTACFTLHNVEEIEV